MVVPFLLIILLVVIDVGRSIFAYNTVAEAARTAARVAIVDQNTTDITNAVINDPRTKWLGLTSANVSVPTPTCNPSSTTLVVGSCIASVTVTYQLSPFIFAAPSVLVGMPTITLSSTSAMPIERVHS